MEISRNMYSVFWESLMQGLVLGNEEGPPRGNQVEIDEKDVFALFL